MIDTQPHLQRLGAWVSQQTWETIPEGSRRAARLQVLNMLATVHASGASPTLRAMLAAAPVGEGTSTVIADGRRVPVADAAYLNAAYSMAQDFDDILWMGHTSHSTVFAALAVAEREGRSAREFLTAVVVANEVAGRLGASAFLGPLNGQMWTFIHLVGAAAATAHLLGLDAERTAHSLAVAMAQPPFALQAAFLAPSSKVLAASTPTHAGVQAAYFARAGMTGALDALEDERGFWRFFAFQALPGMLGATGALWVTQTLTLKTHPTCHYFQTACSALETLLSRRALGGPSEVSSVTVHTTKLGIEVATFARAYRDPDAPPSPVTAAFDLSTAAAIVLHAGRFTGEESEPEWLAANAAALNAWRARVRVVHDPDLSAKVIQSATLVGAGREALAELRDPRALASLAAKYRDHYRSTLFKTSELGAWARAARRYWGAPATATAEGNIPLYFPNRVEIVRADGTRDVEQVDLPLGSMASPSVDDVLRTKLEREVGRRMGVARAQQLYALGMRLEEHSVADLVRAAVCV